MALISSSRRQAARSSLSWAVFCAGLGCACSGPLEKEVFLDTRATRGVSATVRAPSGAFGDICIPLEEDSPEFGGFARGEVSVRSEDAQCASRLCLVDDFQGRVSCPEGNRSGGVCVTPRGEEVTVSVWAQTPYRPALSASYCSCRCDGGAGNVCGCPLGFSCQPRIARYGSGPPEATASYCIKQHMPLYPSP